jgi:hypothetical protein
MRRRVARAEARMPHRQFTDSKRTMWEVWNVEPSHAERRAHEADRRRSRRTSGERRQVEDRSRVRIKSGLAGGWLAFESKHDRRRLAPIPVGWEALDESALERLCEQARSIGRPRRLLE